MKKINIVQVFFCFYFLLLSINSNAQKILNVQSKIKSVCLPGKLSIEFNTDGKVPSGAKFFVVLSDENGLFDTLNPNIIGTNFSSPISVSLSDTLKPSKKYVVNVICTSPIVAVGDTSNVIELKPSYFGFNTSIVPANDTICQGSYTKVDAKLSPSFPNVNYKWYVNGIVLTNFNQASLTTAGISGTGSNFEVYCEATVTDGCIKNSNNDSSSVSNKDSIIVVSAIPLKATFSASPSIVCVGTQVTLKSKVISSAGSLKYKWYYKVGLDTTTTFISNKAVFTDSLPVGAEVYFKVESDASCLTNNPIEEKVNLTILKIIDSPPAITIKQDVSFCEGPDSYGEFSVLPIVQGAEYIWFIDNVALPKQTIQHKLRILKSGILIGQKISCKIKLTAPCVTNNEQKSNEITIVIKAKPIFNLIDSLTITYGVGDTIFLTGDINPSTILWSPSDKSVITNANTLKPVLSPKREQYFKIQALSVSLCPLLDSVKVTVLPNKESFFLPTAFSPNGDLLNDIYYCRSIDNQLAPNSFLMEIFDENGTLVFESKHQNYGWDGTYKTKPCQQGVYIYHVSGTYFNFETFDFKEKFLLIR